MTRVGMEHATGRLPSSFRLAHSLLISRFASPSVPQIPGDARQLEGWASALGESPNSAIERLKRANLLVPFAPLTQEALAIGMNSVYGVAELKVMLKGKGLRVGGKKAELIERLIAADDGSLYTEVSSLGLYHCSDAGRRMASEFETRKSEAHVACREAIEERDYQRAIKIYQNLEDDLGFPKWEFEVKPRPDLIELIMTVRPRILDGCSETVLQQLRTAMALECVAGRHAPRHPLKGIETGTRLDAEIASRMIYFAARHAQDMATWESMGVRTLSHRATGDSCQACISLDGKTWQINEAPELPLVECTHRYGCRCLYLPVLGLEARQ